MSDYIEVGLIVVGASVSVITAPFVLFDATRLRMNGSLVWPLVVLFALPIALPAYVHFRRIHMQRLRDLAAISNTTTLPIVPLHVVRRDLVGVTVGSAIVLFAVVLALAFEIHSLPIGLSILGVGIAGRSARRVNSRSF